MIIRVGFVSNSSSSSFVVAVYKQPPSERSVSLLDLLTEDREVNLPLEVEHEKFVIEKSHVMRIVTDSLEGSYHEAEDLKKIEEFYANPEIAYLAYITVERGEDWVLDGFLRKKAIEMVFDWSD